MVCYPKLIGEMAKREITKKSVARQIGISERALHNKLSSKVPFMWPKVCGINERFFPDMSKDDLFAPAEDQDSA